MFCRYYVCCLNNKEAAIKAGYPAKKAEKLAFKIISKKEVANFINTLQINIKKEKIFNMIVTALKKIIFFRPNDVIFLIKNIEKLSEQDIQNMDLFQISEIKKLKDGSFEFKFLDKLKAIDMLIYFSEKINSNSKAKDFLKALTAKPACNHDE